MSNVTAKAISANLSETEKETLQENIGLSKATSAEINTGTATDRVVTPAGLSGSEFVEQKMNASGDAPMFTCRAWVNFDGTGTLSIRGSGNVSSIIDQGVGVYDINLITAMQDANYSVNTSIHATETGSGNGRVLEPLNFTVSGFRVHSATSAGGSLADSAVCCASIFR